MTPALILIGLLILFIAVEWLIVTFNGTPVPIPTTPRTTETFGAGAPLNYVVMGDSVSVSQGGDYKTSIARSSAEHLSSSNQIMMTNVGVSGARAKDIIDKQLPDAVKAKPDVVLIIVGSNDVTHVTSTKSIKNSINGTIDQLVASNCHVKIVVTGSADMGAPPRLPQPLRAAAGWRAGVVNKTFAEIVSDKQITFAPVAEKTGPTFRSDHSLFAPDKFHPNTEGYKVWTPVINEALDNALTSQPSHCQE